MQNQKPHGQPLLGDDGELLKPRADNPSKIDYQPPLGVASKRRSSHPDYGKKRNPARRSDRPAKGLAMVLLILVWSAIFAAIYIAEQPSVDLCSTFLMSLPLIIFVNRLIYQAAVWYGGSSRPVTPKPIQAVPTDATSPSRGESEYDAKYWGRCRW